MLSGEIDAGRIEFAPPLVEVATIGGSHLEVHDLSGGRWVIDRDQRRYAEAPSDHPVGVDVCGFDWTPYVDIHSDDVTGDLVIHVTPTRIVRLSH